MNQMSAPAPTRGLVVIVVAAVVGVLVLLIGYDDAGIGSAGIDTGSDSAAEDTTDTTVPPVTASTAPAGGAAPAEVPVYVANGSGVSGKAAEITTQLQGLGYTTTLEPGNAPATDISQVFFVPDNEAEAQAVAAALGLAADRAVAWPTPPPFEAPAEATVIVQVGTDLAG